MKQSMCYWVNSSCFCLFGSKWSMCSLRLKLCGGKCPENRTSFSLPVCRQQWKTRLQLVASSAIKIHLSFYFWYLLNYSSINSPWGLYLLMANTIVPHKTPRSRPGSWSTEVSVRAVTPSRPQHSSVTKENVCSYVMRAIWFVSLPYTS